MNAVEATMESLPEEVMEHFGQYLSASDLASCCAVSRKWREIFGRDRLWRVRCNEALADVLDENNSVVEPLFTSPLPDDSTLTSISEWRLNFMKQIRLRNNWILGNFKTEQIRFKSNEPYIKGIFFKDCYLLLFKCSELEVWNIKKSQEFESRFPFKANPGTYLEEFKVFEIKGSDKFVTVNGLVVRVFNLCCVANNLELLHVFSFESRERCKENTQESVEDLFTQKFYEGTLCAVVGNVFVGIYTNPSPPKMHIWNVETGQKLKEVDCPFSTMCWLYRRIPTCEQTMNIVLEGEERVNGRIEGHWYVYSLTRLKLLPFHEIQQVNYFYSCKSIILDKYIAIQVDKRLHVYNYLTSEIVYSKAPGRFVDRLKSLGHFVVFGNRDELCVVNPNNDNSMVHLIPEYSFGEVETVGNMAIITPIYNDDINFTIKCAAVKKIKDRCRWVSVPHYETNGVIDPCLTNQYGTKLILMKPDGISKLNVVHFW